MQKKKVVGPQEVPEEKQLIAVLVERNIQWTTLVHYPERQMVLMRNKHPLLKSIKRLAGKPHLPIKTTGYHKAREPLPLRKAGLILLVANK